MQNGVLFNIQSYSVQDGPGIRTTFFLKGCPLACAWCHNPEGISRRPEIIVVEARCIRCGECFSVCPRQDPNQEKRPLSARPDACTVCGQCADACPTAARTVVGREFSPREVLERAKKDRLFYEESGGGVTFSGGEPLVQPAFLQQALRACRDEQIHTAVDTCGFAPEDVLLEVAKHTDLFLFDLKFINDKLHREYTGVSNALILENLATLGRVHEEIWVRVPLIPGVNDAPVELEQMAAFVSQIPAVRQVRLLPYHRIGLPKWQRLGRINSLAPLQPPSAADQARAVAIFQAAGVVALAGG